MNSTRLLIFLLALHGIFTVNSAKPTDPRQFFAEIGIKMKQKCAGAYIPGYNNHKILTTASCVKKYPNSKVYMRDAEGTRFSTKIKHILVHAHYTQKQAAFDLALVEMVDDFKSIGATVIRIAPNSAGVNCRLHILDSGHVRSEDVRRIKLSRCKKRHEALNITYEFEDTFKCVRSDSYFCTQGRGFLVECDMQLIGVGIDHRACGEDRPYVMFDLTQFRQWIYYNSYLRTDAVTFRIIGLSNISLMIIMLFCILFNSKI